MNDRAPGYAELQQQLDEAREVIRALRQGEVDAIIAAHDIALVRLRATEEALGKLTAELEERVRDRTEQLEEANTRLQMALEELRGAQLRVTEAQRVTALAALAGAIAHEVSSPLMGVLNAVAFVRRQETNPTFREALDDADEGLRTIAQITRNLLALGRSLRRGDVRADVAAVLERTLGMLEAELEASGVTIQSDLPDDLPLIAVDDVRLQQVFTNLLTNALDAVRQVPERRISVQARRHDRMLEIDIEDSGRGVDDSILPRLFEPFVTTKPGRGTGLGLNISRSLLEEHGGSLILERARPARFRLTVPIAGGGQ